jgi:hypothetical protein
VTNAEIHSRERPRVHVCTCPGVHIIPLRPGGQPGRDKAGQAQGCRAEDGEPTLPPMAPMDTLQKEGGRERERGRKRQPGAMAHARL